MPITVVTHRDDVGAPTNREVYAAGGSWRRGPSGLEIYSADRRLVATYPDGNWLSIYVDNSVRVHTEGRPEEEPVPRLAGAAAPAPPRAAPLAAAVAARSGTSTRDDAVLVPDEILPAEPEPATALVPDDESDRAGPTTIDGEPVDAEPIDTEPVDAEAAVGSVDEPADTATEKPERRQAAPERPSSVPAGMRAVTFRPRTIRPARRPEEPSRPTHMRPLVFRTRTIRKPDE